MASPSDYTMKDLKEIDAWMEKHPECWCWTTIEGIKIPLKFIKTPHLKNILKHIDRHIERFNPDTPKILKKELYKRMMKLGPAGKVLYG